VTSAIFGLVGVIVGGVITVGYEAWRDRHNTDAALRAGARAIQDEARWTWVALEEALADSSYKTTTTSHPSLIDPHLDALARHGTFEQWQASRSIQRTLETVENSRKRSEDLPDYEVPYVDASVKLLKAHARTLGPLLQDKPGLLRRFQRRQPRRPAPTSFSR
jgi:hypothetical protein